MRSTVLLGPTNLLSVESVQIGRLVRNAKNPHQDYFYPPNQPQPKIIVSNQRDFQDTIASSQYSQLRARLTRTPVGAIATTAPAARTYFLDNSNQWFRTACRNPETRRWIEESIRDGQPMYLTVGYRVVIDASLHETHGRVPKPSNAGTMISASIRKTRENERKLDAAGEHVYAVQYRKLKFKWYSARDVDHATLERDNRWKVVVGTRGKGDVEMLEVDLDDEIDIEGGDRFVLKDGSEEFIVNWDA